MRIILKVDCNGEPYILLKSDKPCLVETQCVESEMLEIFIGQAKKRGLTLVNESGMSTRNDYASIKLGSVNSGM